jgi:hypothetical protein
MTNSFDFEQDVKKDTRRLLMEERDCTGLPRRILDAYDRNGSNAFAALRD